MSAWHPRAHGRRVRAAQPDDGTDAGSEQPALRATVSWIGIGIGLAVALTVCYGVAIQSWIVGSAEGGWTYPYVAGLAPRPLWIVAIVAAGALTLLLIPITARSIAPLLCAWVVAATGAHAIVRTTAPYDLQTLFLSPGANGFYTFAQERTPGEILARFNRVRRGAPLHVQSNMPGKPLLVHALERISPRTDVLPWLLVGLSNLGAVIVFLLARELFDDRRAALYAAVLYLFTPARVLFFPLMNSVTPVVLLAFAWFTIRWLHSARDLYAVVAGVALYGLILFEPLPLVTGLFFAAVAYAAIARGDLRFDQFVMGAALMLLALLSSALLVRWQTGFDVVRAFEQIRGHAVAFNELAGRSYTVWIRANLGEFLFAAGPAAVFATLAAPLAWRASRARDWLTAPIVSVSLGIFATLIVTNLIGINRGEVVRLWIFLACFVQLPAAALCSMLGHRAAIAALLVAAVLQVGLATATIGFVVP